MKIRTRFSPSPTGMIHLGNARTALFSALFAEKNHGAFVLRIEDTDKSRSEEQYVEALQENLHWLGIKWQEGPGVEGEYGPYWQSQRLAIYEKYYHILEEKKLIYPCFCSEASLQLSRKLQLSRGEAPRYARTCRKLSAEDIAQLIARGEKPAWRFSVPVGQQIEFTDVVKGPQVFQSENMGDFIVRRADGTSPFLFCNAIDDATMHITHVLRGEDHLTNTPRQIMILQALDLPAPHYGHLSLIVGDDGAPLSKRHGSFSLQEMQQQGYLPLALINYFARLGHTCDSQDLLTQSQLAEHFYIEKLSKSPARFDVSQLNFWQKMAVQALDADAVCRWLGEHIADQVPEDKRQFFAEKIKANIVFPEEGLAWVKILFHEQAPLDEHARMIIREAGEQFYVEAEQATEKYGIDLKLILADMKKTLGLSGMKLFMPLRVALSGKEHGPELAAIANILGAEKMKHRFGRAVRVASNKD